jgi:phosphomannomutase
MDQSLAPVFKAYDIRGLSPDQIDAAFARRLGQTLATLKKPSHVMVGRDMRSTSEELERALIEGLTSQGVNVTRIGLCSTPLFNVSVGMANGKYDLGVMVTASHNPSEYNGFKLDDGTALPIGQGSGMEELRDLFLSDATFTDAAARGRVEDDPDALKAYLDYVFSLVDATAIAPMKIAIDAGNGMAGVVLPELARRLPQIEILPLYWDLDGRFPNHEANPLKAETLRDLQAMIKKEGCALGVAFDGDADRTGFVDANGEQVTGDFLTAMIATELLKRHPGSKIISDLRCSWSTMEAIRAAGGVPIMGRVGHAFIKRQMREEGALFAGELAMHFYYNDLWGVESGDLTLLYLLTLVASTKQPLADLWKPLQKYADSGEINSDVKDSDAMLALIKSTYAPQASDIVEIDGIRLEFNAKDGARGPDAWWFCARKSNTEPLVRLIVEAVDAKVMEEKRDELLKMIRG